MEETQWMPGDEMSIQHPKLDRIFWGTIANTMDDSVYTKQMQAGHLQAGDGDLSSSGSIY